MSTLKGLPVWEEHQKLLKSPTKKTAANICRLFVESFGSVYPAERLWLLVVNSMKLDDEEIDGRERGNIINFYEHLVMVFDAIAVLGDRNRE